MKLWVNCVSSSVSFFICGGLLNDWKSEIPRLSFNFPLPSVAIKRRIDLFSLISHNFDVIKGGFRF